MARIVIRNLGKYIEVRDFSKSILILAQEARIDWMHSCGGKGNCTTCKATIIQGEENFNDLTSAELRYKQQGMLADGERLVCQAKVSGDVTIEIPEESKLPHLSYLS